MSNNKALVLIIGFMVAMMVIPMGIMAYQEAKTKQVAMEHGYIQVNGQWVKPEEKK